MQTILESLQGLVLGPAQAYRNLALFPLIADDKSGPEYLLLDESLEQKLAWVTEVSADGNVPELAFENQSAERILLVDGDELIGAKQNRVINLSILVGAGKRIVIPVSCVEQGRWRLRSDVCSSSNSALFAKARAAKMNQVSASLRESGYFRRSNRGAIWNAVAEKAATLGCESETMAMSDLFEARTHDLAAYTSAFRAEPRQRGAVVAVDGKVAGIELFDSAAPFARYLEKLLRSYAMDAIETAGREKPAPSVEEARRFLESLKSASSERFAALGEGEDIRLSGTGFSGAALAADGRVVHLAGYAIA